MMHNITTTKLCGEMCTCRVLSNLLQVIQTGAMSDKKSFLLAIPHRAKYLVSPGITSN